jgi:hypothetical protein
MTQGLFLFRSVPFPSRFRCHLHRTFPDVQDPPSRYLQVLNALPTLGLVDARADSTQRAVKLLTRLAHSTPNGAAALRAVEYYASAELLVVTCATCEDATLLLLRLAQQASVRELSTHQI